MERFELRFQPDGLRVEVPGGTTIADAMKGIGMQILLPCGGTGKCGKCAVEIHPNPPEPGPHDIARLSKAELTHGVRLACRTKVDRPMSVLINPGMRVLGGKILVDGLDRTFDLDSPVAKTYLELPAPSLDDQTPDLLRIARALGLSGRTCPSFDIDAVREMPSVLRASDYRVTVVSADGRMIGVESGDTTSRRYGIAFDIGTTTVVGTVLDLSDGSELGRASRLNAQVVYGEDTISRIRHAIEEPSGRVDLARRIRDVVNEIVVEACISSDIEPEEIYEASFAGNTAMSHLFLGLDPYGLSRIPFVSVAGAAVNLRASDIGIAINPRGNLHMLPNIAGFVGSDTVGVMLAANFLEPGPPRLAIDVGTNGEIAVSAGGTLAVCSTAAGPALEGAALSCGMRAAYGAIEHISITGDEIACEVIGDIRPVGICGSGIIDAVAELLDTGIVDPTGRLMDRDELAGTVSDSLMDRIMTVDGQTAFVFVFGDGGPESRDVILTQRDIRHIQLAKGAISAGMHLLLKELSLTPADLDEVLLAGAFGNFIRKRSALRIGLLPAVGEDRIRFVGNAASTGAKMALLSRAVREDADRIRSETRHVELAALPEFMNAFSDHMMFPEKT